jgi:hypothetical protein
MHDATRSRAWTELSDAGSDFDGYLIALREDVGQESMASNVYAVRAVRLRTHVNRRKIKTRVIEEPPVIPGDLRRVAWFRVPISDRDESDVHLHAFLLCQAGVH